VLLVGKSMMSSGYNCDEKCGNGRIFGGFFDFLIVDSSVVLGLYDFRTSMAFGAA
jgi:hypothetical protein